jgi:flagellar motor switch protein FliN/FliY
MTNHDNQLAIRRFLQGFVGALADSLTNAAGQPWKVTVVEDSDAFAQTTAPNVFRLTFDGLLRGEFFLELDEEQVRLLAAAVRTHAEQPIGNDAGQTLRTILSSAMTSFSLKLFAEYGTVNCKIDQVLNPALKGMFAVPLLAEGRDSTPMSVRCYLDGKLIESLSPRRDMKAQTEADVTPFDPVNLNLVLDVELSMSLRFGVRQLPLREVLELASGSVVELDRQVDDPVELLLDGRVIARGEAVIVDGNYGLRVTEITEPIASNFVR